MCQVKPTPKPVTGSGSAPRGIRNNNPGNIRGSAIKWQGEIGRDDKDFVKFKDMESGIRASVHNARTQHRKGFNTVGKLVNRWAPASDGNNVKAYQDSVARNAKITVNETINWTDKYTVAAILQAMFTHENGAAPTAKAGITTALVQSVITKYAI
jgi:hypothetical protein